MIGRRPSGLTKFLCRIENAPMVGPGDVHPDMITGPAALLMERGLPVAENPVPPVDGGASVLQRLHVSGLASWIMMKTDNRPRTMLLMTSSVATLMVLRSHLHQTP